MGPVPAASPSVFTGLAVAAAIRSVAAAIAYGTEPFMAYTIPAERIGLSPRLETTLARIELGIGFESVLLGQRFPDRVLEDLED